MQARIRLLAFGLSVTLLSSALLLMWYARQFQLPSEQKLLLRPLDLAALPTPPPPPPPSPPQPVNTTPTLDLQVSNSSAVQIAAPDIQLVKPKLELSAPQPQLQQVQWQPLQIEISAFSLDQLDALPVLQTPLNAVFPRSLSRQGIKKALVKLDILIDEQGRLTLLNIIENPYPELRPEIERIVRSSRFSVPTKGIEAVSARFIWPVEFKP